MSQTIRTLLYCIGKNGGKLRPNYGSDIRIIYNLCNTLPYVGLYICRWTDGWMDGWMDI